MSATYLGFLLSRHSRDRNGNNELSYWLASEMGAVKLIPTTQPLVMFIPQDQLTTALACLSELNPRFTFKDLKLRSFDLELMSAFYFRTSHDYHRAQELLRRKLVTVLEADIRPPERYLMERFVKGAVEFTGTPVQRKGYVEFQQAQLKPAELPDNLVDKIKQISLDIECSEHGELYSIGLYSLSPAYCPDGQPFKRVYMIGEAPEADTEQDVKHAPLIHWVADEKSLLLALQAFVISYDPDIFIGWNVINFDFRLLAVRATFHNIKLALGRGGQNLHWRDGRTPQQPGFLTLHGRVVVDGIDSLKTATYSFPSFSLENVAQEILGVGKDTDDVDNRMDQINHDFHFNKPKLAKYNLQDCVLVWDIFVKTRLLDFLLLRSQLTGLELDRNGGSVLAFTNVYLPKLHRAGYIAPNLRESGVTASPGGYVMDSFPGLYDHVIVLDFKSLYPSIIRTFKIDPVGLLEGVQNPTEAIPGFRGGLFDREKHYLPEVISGLWAQRDQAKIDKDAARSQAIKILMNSFYGVLGSGGCRFYDTRLASSITMRGQEIMQTTAGWIEAKGYKVIYGDTDSTFVLLDRSKFTEGDRGEQADRMGAELSEYINQQWQRHLREDYDIDCFLDIEYEVHYHKFLMPTIRGLDKGSKKRYAGLVNTKDGEKLIFKGLETVRTDWTDLAKMFQMELYHRVFHDLEVKDYVLEIVEKTLAGEFNDKLVYRKRLRQELSAYVKNVPPHVKAARAADEKNRQLGQPLRYQHKAWISYVLTLSGPEAVEHQHSVLDFEHYIEKQLKPIADGILPFIGLSFDLITDQQMGLF
ncbi:DNA polymerase II [Moritella sp. 24]|uniref:DNA polymerase II n=1 Tax=Moritella sp. 24 TaxID=2746230 RepID=UPI001BA79A8A|nr:DNA polymerase II [Moritella sp. 24]QUM75708.1 DNA polymerase II [Moritella sp. 24]